MNFLTVCELSDADASRFYDYPSRMVSHGIVGITPLGGVGIRIDIHRIGDCLQRGFHEKEGNRGRHTLGGRVFYLPNIILIKSIPATFSIDEMHDAQYCPSFNLVSTTSQCLPQLLQVRRDRSWLDYYRLCIDSSIVVVINMRCNVV